MSQQRRLEHNAAADRISFLVQRILLEIWTTGIHLVLTTVRTSIPEVMRSRLHNRILALRPGNSISDHTIVTAFSEADREVAGRLAETLSPQSEHRVAILASEFGGVRSFRFTYNG